MAPSDLGNWGVGRGKRGRTSPALTLSSALWPQKLYPTFWGATQQSEEINSETEPTDSHTITLSGELMGWKPCSQA